MFQLLFYTIIYFYIIVCLVVSFFYASTDIFAGRSLKKYKNLTLNHINYNPADKILLNNNKICGPHKNVVKCNLDNNPNECFDCSNRMAVCKHFDQDIIVENANGIILHIIHKNASKNEGYCIETDAEKNSRTCNKYTGDWVLVKQSPLKSTFTFICKCKYPSLVTQANIFNDCRIDVACGPYGHLKTLDVDLRVSGSCICDLSKGYVPDRSSKGPFCRQIIYSELWQDPEFYDHFPHKLNLLHDAISPLFRNQFKYPKNRNVINPCKIDAFTGLPVDKAELVSNSLYSIDGLHKTVWFCISKSLDVATVLFEDDYLQNNGGSFANGVVQLSTQRNFENIEKYYKEIQEWHVPQTNEESIYGPYFGPIIGVRVYILDSKLTFNNKLLDLLKHESSNVVKKIINIDITIAVNVYSIKQPKNMLPFTYSLYNIINYTEMNYNARYPVFRYWTPQYGYETCKTIKNVKPRYCYEMLLDPKHSDDIWPMTRYFNIETALSSEEAMELLRGGSFMGCKHNFDCSQAHFMGDLFLNHICKLFHRRFILNPYNIDNTNVILINHFSQEIESVFYGTPQEQKIMSTLKSGSLLPMRS